MTQKDNPRNTPRKHRDLRQATANFLPTTRREMELRHWDELDILLVSGDAYVDHPGFGVPLLGRLLESRGYKVGIIDQPDWTSQDDIARLGKPRLFCGIASGALDSMLAHYTAFRKKRSDDACTPGGLAGKRPNRASIVYANLIRAAFPGTPIAIGGVEASLRKAAHYDFWTDALRRSILLDAKADILIYGMGERQILQIAENLNNGMPLDNIPGTVVATSTPEQFSPLPSYDDILQDKSLLVNATLQLESHFHTGTEPLAQRHGNQAILIQPSAEPLTTEELDQLYQFPFTREQHPKYTQPVPALDMLKFSITAVRGCAGACAFCSIAQHQGRRISSRSAESLAAEIEKLTSHKDWKGHVSDVGGPTANLWGATCSVNAEKCKRQSCLTPSICPNLKLNLKAYVELLEKLNAIPNVKTVSVASGIRHDAAQTEPKAAKKLIAKFISGHLKLAPEHCDDKILKLMRKPKFSSFENFLEFFQNTSYEHGKQQYIIPFIISAYPGCGMEEMKTVASWFRQRGWKPQQVQCFIPTPGTLATAMFYAECDQNGNHIYVPKTDREREDQHAMLFENRRKPQKKNIQRRGK